MSDAAAVTPWAPHNSISGRVFSAAMLPYRGCPPPLWRPESLQSCCRNASRHCASIAQDCSYNIHMHRQQRGPPLRRKRIAAA